MLPSLLRPLFKPLPLFGLSASSLLVVAATFHTSRSPLSSKMSSSSSTSHNWPIKAYTPRHSTWPYNPSDFTRQDSTVDSSFYRTPRFVTHIDDAAIVSLRAYYDSVLPRQGRILDFCSSWISHYPPDVEEAAQKGQLLVAGLGMNQAELEANPVLNAGRLLVDLNVDPDVNAALKEGKIVSDDEDRKLDAATNVVSTDYLTQPVAVLESLREATKIGGTVHLTISNRCFPTKAISRWLRVNEEERLLMVADFLHFAGWRKIEIVELSNGRPSDASQAQGGLQGLMAFVGMNPRDPLWVVRAVKE